MKEARARTCRDKFRRRPRQKQNSTFSKLDTKGGARHLSKTQGSCSTKKRKKEAVKNISAIRGMGGQRGLILVKKVSKKAAKSEGGRGVVFGTTAPKRFDEQGRPPHEL